MTSPLRECLVCQLLTTAEDQVCASCRLVTGDKRRGKQKILKTTTGSRPRPSARRR